MTFLAIWLIGAILVIVGFVIYAAIKAAHDNLDVNGLVDGLFQYGPIVCGAALLWPLALILAVMAIPFMLIFRFAYTMAKRANKD